MTNEEMTQPLTGEVIENREVASNRFLMTLKAGKEFLPSSPGQFVMIRPAGTQTAILGRPMSIYAVEELAEGSLVEILYQIVGRGTRLISQLKKRDRVKLVGPLGRGFTICPEKKQIVLIAGGMGVAPLTFLGKTYIDMSATGGVTIAIYVGVQSDSCFAGGERLREIGKISISSDDGSCGHYGLVTDLVERDLETFKENETAVYACGPAAMLKKVQEITRNKRFISEASVEERMACGIGACLGCVVRMKDGGYKRACVEGPVFNLEELELD